MDLITETLGLQDNPVLAWVIVGAAALVVVLLLFWLFRRLTSGTFISGGRKHRLAVIDATPVDTRRRLVLLRRDNVEHLIMIGGPSDIVIETGIGAKAPVSAFPAPQPMRRQNDEEEPVIDEAPPARKAVTPPAPVPVPQPKHEEPILHPEHPRVQIAEATVERTPRIPPAPAPVQRPAGLAPAPRSAPDPVTQHQVAAIASARRVDPVATVRAPIAGAATTLPPREGPAAIRKPVEPEVPEVPEKIAEVSVNEPVNRPAPVMARDRAPAAQTDDFDILDDLEDEIAGELDFAPAPTKPKAPEPTPPIKTVIADSKDSLEQEMEKLLGELSRKA
jgi:hypothetical protein